MYRMMMLTAACLVFVTVQAVANGQESTRADFDEYCKAMVGTWRSNVTLPQDMPGLGKKGDKFKVRAVNTLAVNGNAIVGKGDEGKGGAVSLTYYDAEKKQIKGVVAFAGGTVISAIVSKQDNGKWESIRATVKPDGTKTERTSTLVITDEGNTHTWTQDGVSNVWRRTKK